MKRIEGVRGVTCATSDKNKMYPLAADRNISWYFDRKNFTYLCIVHQFVHNNTTHLGAHFIFLCIGTPIGLICWCDRLEKGQRLVPIQMNSGFCVAQNWFANSLAHSISTPVSFDVVFDFDRANVIFFSKIVLFLAATKLSTTSDIHMAWHIRRIIGI